MRNRELSTKRLPRHTFGALVLAAGALAITPSLAASFQTVMSGAALIWPDDHFVGGREALTGRSVAEVPAACSQATGSANLGSLAERMVFDSYLVRCGGFVPMPADPKSAR